VVECVHSAKSTNPTCKSSEHNMRASSPMAMKKKRRKRRVNQPRKGKKGIYNSDPLPAY